MVVKKTTRSASSAAKAKKATVTLGDSTESMIENVISTKTKKAPAKRVSKKAVKKTVEKPGEKKFAPRSYSLSGVDVTGRNLVIVESPAKGKTIK